MLTALTLAWRLQVSMKVHMHRTTLRLVHFESFDCTLQPLVVATDDEFMRRMYGLYQAAAKCFRDSSAPVLSHHEAAALGASHTAVALLGSLERLAQWWQLESAVKSSLANALAVFLSRVTMSNVQMSVSFTRTPIMTEGFSVAAPLTITLDAVGIMGELPLWDLEAHCARIFALSCVVLQPARCETHLFSCAASR